MYKCKDCGMEFETKPDYCDCGNDEFYETAATAQQPIEQAAKKDEEPAPKTIPASEFNPNTEKYEPKLQRFNVDPISIVIFILCIILSFIVIFFMFNPEETESPVKQTESTTVKSIPPIDKFWNNAVPAVPEAVAVKVAEPVKTVTQPVKKPTANTAAKPASKPAAKPVTTQKTTTTKQTTVKPKATNTVSQAEQAQKAEEAKKKAEEDARKKAEENKKKLEEVKKNAEDLQQSMSSRQEYANYKANLRNTIGRKIDFTKVVGDGDCTISFKIDPSGKLVNGAFAKQSTNMTLNDAVYNAFMSSRSFNPPPNAYNNETLRLYVRFYNGNFEISLN